MKLNQKAKEALYNMDVPQHDHHALVSYLEDKIPPGGFLRAVINNDLRGACERADLINQRYLFNVVNWLYNHAPAGSWGYEGAWEAYCGEQSVPSETHHQSGGSAR